MIYLEKQLSFKSWNLFRELYWFIEVNSKTVTLHCFETVRSDTNLPNAEENPLATLRRRVNTDKIQFQVSATQPFNDSDVLNFEKWPDQRGLKFIANMN